ncbi:MAG: adenylate/guanylate cyclase domain-containing protein [Alphaproteobacteria bacterium]|nr:adenylate/guanylate cyclase domain-containing protein [Alphaproteobacteria bacterium]
MAKDIRRWLEGLDLGRYVEMFQANAVDLELLLDLDEADLEKLGVAALGHRKKLLRAIAELGSEPASTATAADATRPSEAERRQLTVMFCDLVGSTALSEQLDPEDLRAVIGAFQMACAGVIAGFEGYIARYMGDGLLVYFGYPQAHEDDAERAVRAGLGIVAAVGNLKTHQNEMLEVRVGIATGLVVVGDIVGEGASEERAVTGETPNLAARLQGIAGPNTVVIADSTQRLIRGLFDCDELEPRNIKGISEPVRAYQVLAASDASSRFEASAAGGLTPLVGREEEIGLLLKRWRQAQEGEGQVVLLSGEAGVGKSRILRGLQERLEGEVTNRVLYYCSPYYQNSALYPVIEQLRRALRFERDDGTGQKFEKLVAVLSGLALASDERTYLLATLLSLSTEGRYPDLDLTPQQIRAMTLDAAITVIEAMAAQNTVLMVVEDVHWIDPSTQEFLGQLVERSRAARLLLVITFRPEFTPPWSGQARVGS